MCLNKKDINEVQTDLLSKIVALISDYLGAHISTEIRGDLEFLRELFDKEVNLFDKNFDDDTIISIIGKKSDAVQVYFINHYKPFVKYDESSVLIMAFCGYISVLCSKNNRRKKKGI